MKHIKTFESFKINEGIFDDIKAKAKKIFGKGKNIELRQPKEVNRETFYKKLGTFGKVPFTAKEAEFFMKLKNKNRDYLLKVKGYGYDVELEKPIIYDFDTIDIIYDKSGGYYHTKIIKLDDEWYLIDIYVSGYDSQFHQYLICDEWEEVLGYLESKKFIL
jgi:hypothetical protein